MKNNGHDALISNAYILEAKRHDVIVEVDLRSCENSLFSVIRIYLDVVVVTESVERPTVALTSMSMFGKLKPSFGYALLRSRKSIQHLICPFFFFTNIMLASQVR